MPDNGDLLFQGITQGFANYKATREQDLAASGQLDALLGQGGPQAAMALSPNGQKLAQKYLQGKAALSDKMQLLGEVNTTIQMRQAAAAYAKAQADVGLAQGNTAKAYGDANFANAQANRMNAQISALQQDAGGGQPGGQPQTGAPPAPDPAAVAQFAQASANPVGGTGAQGAPAQTQVLQAPPTPVNMSSPEIQQLRPIAARQALISGKGETETDILQKQIDAINKQRSDAWTAKSQATAPTGRYYNLGPVYKDGVLQGNDWRAEIMTGAGTTAQKSTYGKDQIIVPSGGQAPGPMVDMAGNRINAPEVEPEVNTNDPEFGKSLQAAFQGAASSSIRLANAKMLLDAATAYTSGDMNRFNAIRGDPTFAKTWSVFSGTNPAAAFKTALAANTQSVLNQIRGPNGSVGGRILMPEYENSAKVLPDMTADNDSIMAAARNNYILADRQNNIDRAYAEFHKTMAPSKAYAMAVEHFGLDAPNLQTGMPPVQQASANAAQNTTAGGTAPGMVTVKSPSGKVWQIPKEQAQAALKRGFTPVP